MHSRSGRRRCLLPDIIAIKCLSRRRHQIAPAKRKLRMLHHDGRNNEDNHVVTPVRKAVSTCDRSSTRDRLSLGTLLNKLLHDLGGKKSKRCVQKISTVSAYIGSLRRLYLQISIRGEVTLEQVRTLLLNGMCKFSATLDNEVVVSMQCSSSSNCGAAAPPDAPPRSYIYIAWELQVD